MTDTPQHETIYRLVKKRGDNSIALVSFLWDGSTRTQIGRVEFSDMQAVHDFANAMMDVALDPPNFAGWDLSLHDD